MPLPTPSIADAPRSVDYTPNNSAGPFPVPFPVFEGTGDDLAVTLDGVPVTNWTFAGDQIEDFYGSPGCWVNGTITFDAPITGALRIAGRRRPRRVDQFAEGRGVPARDHNLELNRLTATQREIFDRVEDIAAATSDIIPAVTALTAQAQQAASDAAASADDAEDWAVAAEAAAQLLATHALPDGTDFNALDQRGTYILTSETNAPLPGPTNRWVVEVVADPADADRVVQRAYLLVGGAKLELANRRRLAGATWEPWLLGAGQAVDVGYDDSTAFPGATNVQEALEMSAAWIGAIRDVLMLQEFVAGLTLSNNAGDPNNKIDIAPGRTRGNGVTVVNPATITAALGAVTPNTTYHIHALRNNATGEFSVTADVSPTSPYVAPGYTRVQRLGAIMTDGSGNIRPFVQDGNEFRYAVSGGNGVSAYGSTVGNRAYSLLTCPVPTGVRLKLLLSLTLGVVSTPNPQDGGEAIFGDGANTDVRTHIHRWGVTSGGGTGIAFWTMDPVSVRTNTSGQIYFGIQSASGTNGSQLWVRGWIDESIPRIGK